MKNLFLLFILSLSFALSGCAEFKQAGRSVGHATRDVAKDVGHGTRDAAKAVGAGTKRVVKSVTDDD